MTTPTITRRTLAGALGAVAGATLFDTRLGRLAAQAAIRRGMPDDAILLNSNENPYGPSAKALEAASRSSSIANRYPDSLEDEARGAIAKHHGVTPDRIVLGCGSSEILQMADLAFTSPERPAVVAEPTFEAVLQYARAIQAPGVKVPLTADFRHDLPKMAAAVRPKRVSSKAAPAAAPRAPASVRRVMGMGMIVSFSLWLRVSSRVFG